MFEAVREAEKVLKEVVSALDPEVLEPATAAKLVERFGRIKSLASAGETLAAGRVASSGVWKKDGERSSAHWLANRTGTSVGQAVATIETANRLSELPQTLEAVRSGQLSETQTKEIAQAAFANPSTEGSLLEVAKKEGVSTLRQECARVKAAANQDEINRYNRIRSSRFLRHFLDSEGAFRLEGRFTPDAGAELLAALEPYRAKVFSEARSQGRKESYNAYCADALVMMAKDSRFSGGNPSKKGPGTLVRVLLSAEALKRGNTEDGELCEIEGVGPIPVATAKALAEDSILAALITDGTDIKTVSHIGRTITAKQRTALEVRDQCCVVPTCDVRDHLETDHINGREGEGAKTIDYMARLCPWHHYLKTYKGWKLSKGPDGWKFEPP